MNLTRLNPSPYQEIVDRDKIAKDPLVSILMMAYNHEGHVARAIESVLSQDGDLPCELIVGEDCSADHTRDIARAYQRQYPRKVRVIYSDNNVGAKQNMLRISNAARGKYVAYCEGDDYWHNRSKLDKQVSFLSTNPTYGLVHSDYDVLYEGRRKLVRNFVGILKMLDDSNAFCEVLINRRIILTVTVCLVRALLSEALQHHAELMDDSWPMSDLQTWLEVARVTKIKYLPESLATYYVHPESASQSRDLLKVLRFRKRTRDLILHYAEKYSCPVEIKNEARAIMALGLMRYAYEAEDSGIMEELLQDTRPHFKKLPFTSMLYYYGARGGVLRSLVRPGLLAIRILNRARGVSGWRTF